MSIELAAAAVAALAPYLASAADSAATTLGEKAVEGGGRLLTWLREKLTGRAKDALGDLESDPQSADNQADLRKQIAKQLESEPELHSELQDLVSRIKASDEAMVQNVSGTGAIGNMVRGNDNDVTVRR